MAGITIIVQIPFLIVDTEYFYTNNDKNMHALIGRMGGESSTNHRVVSSIPRNSTLEFLLKLLDLELDSHGLARAFDEFLI